MGLRPAGHARPGDRAVGRAGRRWSRPGCWTGPASPTGCRRAPARIGRARPTTAGRWRPGAPANLVARRPGRPPDGRPGRAGQPQSATRRTPGTTLPGRVVATFLRGEPTVLDGKLAVMASAAPALLVLEDGRTFRGEAYGAVGRDLRRGGLHHRHDRLPGDADRPVATTARSSCMTAPHIGNTGVNDEDAESGRIWVAGYVVRDPARRPSSTGGHRRTLDDELAGAGRRRHQRHRHPRADPAPARARRDAGRRLQRGRPTRRALLAAGAGRARRWPGADLPARSPPPSRTSCRPTGEQRFTVAALDLGIKRDDAAPDGRARHRDARAAGDRRPWTTCWPPAPDGVFFSNGPGRPGHRRPRGRR